MYGNPCTFNVIARLSMSCCVQRIFVIKSWSCRKTEMWKNGSVLEGTNATSTAGC